MNKFRLLMFCALSAAISAAGQAPVTTFTDPVGFVSVTVPAQADAILAVPMRRTAVFQGAISAIAGTQVTLSSTPTIPAGVTCALVLVSGAKDGLIAKITSQAGAVVTVALDAGENFTGVVTGASGDKARIIPYWTPATLIPSTAPVGTQILGFENAGAGINLSSTRIYVHNGSGAWENGANGSDASATALPFGAAVVVRNTSATPLALSFVGDVPLHRHRMNLNAQAPGTSQDIRFGYGSPVLETLDQAGLGVAAEGDQIFGFNNTAPGYNKAAAQLLVREGGAWKDQVTGQPVGATFQFTPGFGYVFRKAASSPAATLWSNPPGYLPLGP